MAPGRRQARQGASPPVQGGDVHQEEKAEREAWKAAPIPDLVRYLVDTCHLECRQDMARLETHAELAVLEARQRRPDLIEIRNQITRFCSGMRAHLALEERSLFPTLLARSTGTIPEILPESIEPLRRLLEGDHEAEACLLRNIRGLSAAMDSPADALGTQGRMQESIRVLSRNLQRHLYMENQILFPRAQ